MPLISYSCNCGELVRKYFKSAKDAEKTVKCAKCGSEAVKSFGATSSSYKITIDLPGMVRSVDVSPDIEELNQERSDRDYSEDE